MPKIYYVNENSGLTFALWGAKACAPCRKTTMAQPATGMCAENLREIKNLTAASQLPCSQSACDLNHC